MNKASRFAAKIGFGANPFHTGARFFHCTPVLERKKRTHWDSTSSFRSSPRKCNQYSKRLRRQILLHNVSEFAEHLFQSWQSDTDEFDQHFDRETSWFRPNFTENGSKKGKSRYRTSRASRDFEFCDDDDDEVEFETIFRSAFGGTRGFYWSFTINDEPDYRSSSSYYSNNYRTSSSRRRKYEYEEEEEEYDSSSDYEIPMVDMTVLHNLNTFQISSMCFEMASRSPSGFFQGKKLPSVAAKSLDDPNYPTLDERTEYFSKQSSYSRRSFEKAFPNMSAARDERLALGLPAAGPLNLEDVKIAYRSCALKWHPDHHHNSSKFLRITPDEEEDPSAKHAVLPCFPKKTARSPKLVSSFTDSFC
ncbi:Chaperone DnaJ-domain superfamily protein [Striga hermonthica]|uniref:Chaperone DnaJ-domain superfamily protein n=1 Tax=Striga hermonthica TaxID=68872 RepID=A0A9N7RQM9_STRHE|nr:Chaperone DnaJ-domain superfamily protein [Striga hermonthica]